MRNILHHVTRETPAEVGPSDLSKPCLYSHKCGHDEIDLDEDAYATVDTPIGELIVCEEHIANGQPLITCGCSYDFIELRHTGVGQWQSTDNVVVIDGDLWNSACAAEHLA